MLRNPWPGAGASTAGDCRIAEDPKFDKINLTLISQEGEFQRLFTDGRRFDG
jgi:hypothetical protein